MDHEAKSRDRLKLLVVDDMVTMRRTIRSMLRQIGYVNIAEAEDGVGAWKRMSAEEFDVAIVDWNMPNMNGITLLRKTRQDERFARIPFIMVTAEVDEETIAEAAETEVDAYIIKPFVAKVLEEKIEHVLERKWNPSPIETHLNLAYVYAHAGQYNKATTELRTALVVEPNNPRVLTAFGDLYRRRGMLDDAEKAYKKALLLEPKFMKAHDGLAEVLAKKGDQNRLIAAMKEAVAISPKNAARQVKLGRVLLSKGMTADAQRAFRYAVTAEPLNSATQKEIGEIFLSGNMDQEAVEVFTRVLNINPEEVHVYNRLGIAYRKQGKYLEAINAYKRALTIDPQDENLYYNIGRACLEAGMPEEAMVQFRKALDLSPGFREASQILREVEATYSDLTSAPQPIPHE